MDLMLLGVSLAILYVLYRGLRNLQEAVWGLAEVPEPQVIPVNVEGPYVCHQYGETVIVSPVDDLVDHDLSLETGGDCVCGPTVTPLELASGSMGWLIVHHSLDARECAEPDHDRENCPRCQARV